MNRGDYNMRHGIKSAIVAGKWTAGTLTAIGITAGMVLSDNPKGNKSKRVPLLRKNDPASAKLLTNMLVDTYQDDFFLTLLYNDFKNGMFLGTYHLHGVTHELIWSNHRTQLSVYIVPTSNGYKAICDINGLQVTRVDAVVAYANIHKSIEPTNKDSNMSKNEMLPLAVINAIHNEAPITAKFISDRQPKAVVTYDAETDIVSYHINNSISPWIVSMRGGRPLNITLADKVFEIGTASDTYLKHSLGIC